MKRIILALIASVCLVSSCQQDSPIKELGQRFCEAQEKQQSDLLMSLFAPDAILVDLTSKETVEGQKAIADHFIQKETPKVSITIKSINFQNPSTAVMQGTIDYTFASKEKESQAFKGELVRSNDSWLIQKWTEITLISPPTEYTHLKELRFLEGDWENGDEDTTFVSINRWEKNKNFLTQAFTLTVLGQRELSGTQIIGWDPVEKKISSWIFDSDGGLGSSTWVLDGKSWYITSTYKLADERKATATNIITQVDDSSYLFSSVGRDIDGIVLPNIGPFTMRKVSMMDNNSQ